MDISAVKELRQRTGAGVMSCKHALEEAGGDMEEATQILRRQGLAWAEGKAGREVRHGLVEAYIHAGGRIGALVEVNCETDFVARTDEFRALAHDLAMQVAATGPRYLSPEEVPEGAQDDPAELCLLAQPFIKDPSQTTQQLIAERIARVGENIRVGRFTRYELGA